MRVLKFNVDGQTIVQDPTCDFSGLVPGSAGYLIAEFNFSPEWSNCVKVAAFYSALGREYKHQILHDGKTCVIPQEALAKRTFKIEMNGRCPNYILKTNKVAVSQNGG